ncbi:hypothetical protein GCM10027360_48450 [Amycolatopsis echigonensis]
MFRLQHNANPRGGLHICSHKVTRCPRNPHPPSTRPTLQPQPDRNTPPPATPNPPGTHPAEQL